MRKKQLFALIILSVILGCKTPVATETSNTKPKVLPFDIAVVPSGDTINGGAFLSLTAKSSVESWSIENTFNMIVGLSYWLWPGVISVSVDGNSLNQYQEDVSSGTPLGSHIWSVTANPSDGIPSIIDTIRAVPSVHLSSPAMFDTVSRPVTLTWNSSSDSTSHIIIMVSAMLPVPASPDTTYYSSDTLGTTYIPVLDNGSYTLSSSDLNHVPSGWTAKIGLVRLVQDIKTISSKEYLFVNACEENIYLVIN